METQPLQLKIDSKQARADLEALANALNQTGAAVSKMEKSFATGMSGVDRSLKTSMGSMEKFAQIAGLLGKIKLSGDPSKHIRDFANALNTLARAKAIDPRQITQIKTLATTLSTLKVPTQAARLTQFLNAVGAAKAPSAGSVQRISELLKVLNNFQGAGVTRNTAAFGRFFQTVGAMKVPTAASIQRLEQMFKVLASAKGVPNAQAIVHELDMVAAAASRAGTAMNTLPRRVGGLSPAMQAATKSTSGLHSALSATPTHAARANTAFGSVGARLSVLGDRFKLTYQLGTIFSAMFSAFTVGQFVKGLYDVNVELLKLQKAMLFQTGTMEDAHKATDEFIGITDKLGLNLRTSMEAYGRFSISAKASGLDLRQTNDAFRSVGTALQVVGADSHQTTLAFYSLTEMLQKGTVHSKEFNRQLGQQIPGNATLGAQALSKLEGRFISVSEFFQKMQKGQILSSTFVPAYSKVVEETYKPLLGLVKMRPDAALNSLRTAFVLFAREAGNAGFLGALSNGLQTLHDKIVIVDKDGVEHLQPKLAELANTMGKNLANMLHALTQGLGYLVDHLDVVVLGFKGLLGLKVAGTFMDWSAKANAFTAEMSVQQAQVLKNAQASLIDAQAKRAQALASAQAAAAYNMQWRGAAAGAVMGAAPMRGGYTNFSPYGSTLTTGGAQAALAAAAAQRAAIPAGGYGGVNLGGFAAGRAVTYAGAGLGVVGATTAMERLGAAIAGAGGAARAGAQYAWEGVKKFGALLPGLGTIAIAAAVGLAVFSNEMTEFTTKQGNRVKVGDITSGFLDTIGEKIGKWFSGLLGFGDKFEKQAFSWGTAVALFLASLETLVGTLFAMASTIGKTFATALSQVVTLVVGLGSAIAEAATGHFGTAKKVLGTTMHEIAKQGTDYFSGVASDFKVADAGANLRQIMSGAATSADKGAASAGADAATKAITDNAEQQLALIQKQQQDEETRGEIEQLNRRMSMGEDGIPTITELLKQIDETAANQAAATKATADAANSTANAANRAASTPAATGSVAAAIHKAATATGVDEALLTRIAYKESSFNPNARPRDAKGNIIGTAGGLFQFNDETANQLGLANRYDPEQAAIAAARLAKINGAYLQGKLGREATGGEIYAAHFLGAAGATALSKTAESKPGALAASMFAAPAAANPDVFYANGKALTVKQVMDKLNAVGGAQTGLTGQLLAPATPGDEETYAKKLDTAYAGYQKLIGQHNPAQEAISQLQEFRANAQAALETQATLKKSAANMKEYIKPEELLAEEKRLQKIADDYANPFAKAARQSQEANDVTAMRVKGLSDEADFQAKLNQLVEEGYDAMKLDTQANRDSMRAMKDRTDLLDAQLDATKALNEATISRIGRTQNPLAADIASHIKINEGQTYAQALADAKANGSYASIVAAAQTREGERVSGAQQSLGTDIAEMQASQHMSASARSYRDDFKSYLSQLSGISNATLEEMEKRADPALVAMAKHAADIKDAIEHGPGFRRWADQLEPLKNRLEDIKANFAETLSSSITDALSGDKVDWQNVFKNIQKELIKAQVDTAMGSVIGFLTGKGAPQKPEDIAQTNSQAAVTFSAGADTFDQAVATFAQSVSTAVGQIGAAGAGSGFGSAIAPGSLGAGLDTSLPSLPAILGGDGAAGADANNIITIMGKRAAQQATASDAIPLGSLGAGLDTTLPTLPDIIPAGSGGGLMGMLGSVGSGIGGMLGGVGKSLMGNPLGSIGLIGALIAGLSKHKSNTNTTYPVNGVIGESRPVNISATEVAGHSNPIGTLLSLAVSAGAGSMFGPGSAIGNNLSSMFGGQTLGMAGAGAGNIAKLAGLFSEGGYTTSPVGTQVMSMGAWRDAPHYSEGVGNTTGIAAYVHPNEAVIPLTRGRKIPVEMGGDGGGRNVNVTSHITVIAPNPDSFRQAQSSITRQQNRDLRRSANRNLTGR